MLLRTIEQTDLANGAALYSEVFGSAPWSEPWNIQSAHLRLQHFFASPGFVGVIALDGGIVIGFALGTIEPFHSGSLFYLREMCVSPKLRRSGIGKALMNELENALHKKNARTIYLITERETPAAVFYLEMGFALSQTTGFYAKRLSVPKPGENA